MIGSLPVTINNYIFKKILGKGGFSTVYLVESIKYNYSVFVAKVTRILPEPLKDGEQDSIDAEINALMSLCHQNIIKLYDHFQTENNFFMILEYCSNGSLNNDVYKDVGMPLHQFVHIGRQILSALAFCHSKMIAHRDLKPGNILIDSQGHVKLSDFGISIANADNVINEFSGSLLYEPPEVILKKPHNPIQGDIWSLGVLFSYMINGITPWRCDNIGVLNSRICSASYKLRSSTPPEVASIIKKMLVVEPSQRESAQDLLNEPLFAYPQFQNGTEFIQDALSPRGRAKSQSIGFERTAMGSKSMHIYQMGILVGSSRLPKLKPRYHVYPKDTFAME